ncbi:MAG: hypothetical protein ACT4ON_12540 [Bacteroidota bacterium]
MITFANYNETTKNINWNVLPEILKRTHKELIPPAQAGEYNTDKDVKRVVDNYISKLNAAVAALPLKPQKQKSIVEKPKPKKIIVTPAAKPTKENQSKLVERVDDEITLIKRYLRCHNKNKTKAYLLNILKAVQKAILERRVNKKSMYAAEIMQIQDSLIGVVQERANSFDVTINNKRLERYTEIAESVAPMLSVSLLKRYVNLQEQPGVREKAKRLKHDIERAFELQKITSSDKYYHQVRHALRNIERSPNSPYISSTQLTGIKELWDNAKIIPSGVSGTRSYYDKNIIKSLKQWGFHKYFDLVEPKQIKQKHEVYALDLRDGSDFLIDSHHNLQQLINSYDFAFGIEKTNKSKSGLGFIPTIVAAAAGGMVQAITHKALNGDDEVMSIDQAKNAKFEEIGLTGEFLKLIGRACKPISIFIYGYGGSGKSGLTLKLAETFNKLGNKVLYIAGEQFGTPTFTELVQQTNISGNADFKIVKKLGTLDLNDFDLIVIDSKESLNIHKSKDFKELKDAYPDKSFIITSQATKSGDYAGDGKWYNEMDTFIYCENGKASTTGEKNRWGGKAEIKLF